MKTDWIVAVYAMDMARRTVQPLFCFRAMLTSIIYFSTYAWLEERKKKEDKQNRNFQVWFSQTC